MNQNDTPAHIFDALRRFYRCNQTQLAARLGVSTRTLRRYENGEAPPREIARARAMLAAALRDLPAHNAEQDATDAA